MGEELAFFQVYCEGRQIPTANGWVQTRFRPGDKFSPCMDPYLVSQTIIMFD